MYKIKKYKIIEINHSGRKGLRDSPVDDYEYDNVTNSIIESRDLDGLSRFDCCHWKFINSESDYEWWETTPTIALSKTDKMYKLETINTIYILEDVTDD